jgi:membrane protease YdiL (CAAX protease family)
MEKPEAPCKSVKYLIAVAIGWQVLAFLPPLLLYFTIERGQGRVVSLEVRALLIEIAKLMTYAITFFGIYVQGRIIGDGDVRAGLGYQPISRRPVVALMAILTATRAIQWDIMLYEYHRDLVYKQLAIDVSSPWLSVFQAFEIVLLTPLYEELFFRGWLWTGLRKHWGALPTAALTSTAWLAPHLSITTIAWLLPVAVILSVARHFGQSVRASIPLHMLYNFVVFISPRALNAAGLL